MSSYPFSVLPAPPQYGFAPSFFDSFNKGTDQMGSAYQNALIKKQFDTITKTANQKKIADALSSAQGQGLEQESMSIDPQGNQSYKMINPKYSKALMPTFDQDLSEAAGGKKTFDQVKTDFPSKFDEINKAQGQLTPINPAQGYQEPKGFLGFGAGLDEKTHYAISQIKNKYDLDEFLASEEDLRKEGINVDEVKKYFGVK